MTMTRTAATTGTAPYRLTVWHPTVAGDRAAWTVFAVRDLGMLTKLVSGAMKSGATYAVDADSPADLSAAMTAAALSPSDWADGGRT